ncbi:unnamed protein product [Prorocentrum cordatum]|uniref:Ubiquitin-fold modifier-conjugating enzyme 1 n=1 Tax=Prorocentrum cordatum TaxID=2364126 RepID=A0ABN9QIN2_9DINO|nr:unnamed protein product [Polarella glacialis]
MLARAADAAALEEESSACAEAQRVELLQHRAGAAGGLAARGLLTGAALGGRLVVEADMSMVKSTFAVSSGRIGNSMQWKQRFLPTYPETEENEPMESTGLESALDSAIATGHGDERHGDWVPDLDFDPLSIACGKAARVRMDSTVTRYQADEDTYVKEMSHFSFHGVWAGGSGYDREVGGLTVSEVEDLFQQGLGDLKEYSPWMDIHAGLYDNDIDSYVERFNDYSYPFLALRWPSAVGERLFYSLISHVNNTQEVFEIVSAVAPSSASLPVTEFPMPRHVFRQEEIEWLQRSKGPVQLHVSRTHRDLNVVKAHYKSMFGLDPEHEMHDAGSGVSFVSFWHQVGVTFHEKVRVQVMYWSRSNQAATADHTTAWLEAKLEHINSEFMRSYKSCVGYMLFDSGGSLWTGYFPLPGGFYAELIPNEAVSPEGTQAVVQKIPLLAVAAGPRDKEKWIERLKEELGALIQYVQINKENDNDWFNVEPNEDGTKWKGTCWYVHNLLKYEFALQFEIPAGYPSVPIELELPELDGKTPKMYRGGKICLDIHFSPLWRNNVPKFGIAHALSLALGPWLAADRAAPDEADKEPAAAGRAGVICGAEGQAQAGPQRGFAAASGVFVALGQCDGRDPDLRRPRRRPSGALHPGGLQTIHTFVLLLRPCYPWPLTLPTDNSMADKAKPRAAWRLSKSSGQSGNADDYPPVQSDQPMNDEDADEEAARFFGL